MNINILTNMSMTITMNTMARNTLMSIYTTMPITMSMRILMVHHQNTTMNIWENMVPMIMNIRGMKKNSMTTIIEA